MRRAIAFICALTVSSFAVAEDQKAALDAIASFAERVCKTASDYSSSEEIELSGTAKAELKGLLKKVVDLGVEGAAEYRKAESVGVLQKDLAPLLSKGADCKLEISNKLIDKLILSSSQNMKKYPVKLRGTKALDGYPSGMTMTIQIDEDQDYVFDNMKGPLTVDVGELEEGAHTFNFTNVVVYFMNPQIGPQQTIGGLSCEGEFTVAKKKTYQIIAWLDGSGFKCDLR